MTLVRADIRNITTTNMTSPIQSTACQQPVASQQQQQQQQQDLIRLLAQHFNQQAVYSHMTNSNTTAIDQHPSSSSASPANNIDALHQSLAQQIQREQRQQQHNSQMSPDAVNFSLINRRNDLAAAAAVANLVVPVNQSSQQTLRSRSDNHQPPLTGFVKSNGAATAAAMASNNAPLSALGSADSLMQPASNHLLNPMLNDMNLFSALNCFNMTNDQFMLTLQQQYLLQAASAASRQYSFKQNLTPAGANLDSSHQPPTHQFSQFMQQHAYLLHQQQQQQQQQQQREHSQTNPIGQHRRHQAERANKKGADLRGQSDDSGNLLKFSISTILGQGSPVISAGQVAGNDSHSSELILSDKLAAVAAAAAATDDAIARERVQGHEQLPASSPECDPSVLTDLSSESGSARHTPQLPATTGSNAAQPYEHYQSVAASRAAAASSLVDQVARFHQAAAAAASAEHQRPPASMMTNQQQASGQQQQQQQQLTFLAGSTAFPWTAAARGKPRRGMMRRAVFSDSQRVGLEKRFQLQKYISKPDRRKLAEKLGLRDSQVKIWFQNRRMKWRNSKERELLSAGGSREQTLPTRNNPNPDLSDVGETIKKISSTTPAVAANGNTAAM